MRVASLLWVVALPSTRAFDASVSKCYKPSKECAVQQSSDPTSAYQALVANHMCIEDDEACLVQSYVGCAFLDGRSASCRRCFTSCGNAESFLADDIASTLVNFCGHGTTIQYCDVCLDGKRCPDQTLSAEPTPSPTKGRQPTPEPTTKSPTSKPTSSPTKSPTKSPTMAPSKTPTSKPSAVPTRVPTRLTLSPTLPETESPTKAPTRSPTHKPRKEHTEKPTPAPTVAVMTSAPTGAPTGAPTQKPTKAPKSDEETEKPTRAPRTHKPTTSEPTKAPKATDPPTAEPSKAPKKTHAPTEAPSEKPMKAPKPAETDKPTKAPKPAETEQPTPLPTRAASATFVTPAPTAMPSKATSPPVVVAPDVVILGQVQLPLPDAVAMGSAGTYFDPSEVQAALAVFFRVERQHVSVSSLPLTGRRLQQQMPEQQQQQQKQKQQQHDLHGEVSSAALHRQLHRHLSDIPFAAFDLVLGYFGADAQSQAEQSLTAVDDASQWDQLGATLDVSPEDITINSLSYPAAPGDVSATGGMGPVVMPGVADSSAKGVPQQTWLWVSVSVGAVLVCLAAASLMAGQQRRKRRRLERVQPRACGTGMSSLDTSDDGELVAFGGRPAHAPGLKLVSVDLDGMGDDARGYPTVVATGYATDGVASYSSYGGSRRSRRTLLAPGAGHVLPAVALATSYGGSRVGDEFEGAMSMQHDTPLASAGAAYVGWTNANPNGRGDGADNGNDDGNHSHANSSAPVVTAAMMRAIRSLRSSGTNGSNSEGLASPTAPGGQNSGSAAGSYRRGSNYSYGHNGARSVSQGSSYTYWVPPPPSEMGRSSSMQYSAAGGAAASNGGLSGLAAAVAESVRSVRQSSTARSFATLPDDAASVAGRRAVALPAPLSPSSAGLGGGGQLGGGSGGRFSGQFHGHGGRFHSSSSAWETSSAGGSPTRASVISSRHSSPMGGAVFERAWMQQRTLDMRVAERSGTQRAQQSLAPEASGGTGAAAWDSDPYRHGREDPAAATATAGQEVLPMPTSRPELF